MVILRFSARSLYILILCSGLCAVLFLALFLHPEAVAHMRRIGIFATSFGHYLLLPPLFLVSLAGAVNGAAVVSGDLAAITSDHSGLKLRSFWRSHRIPWSHLLRVRVEQKLVQKVICYSLLFDVTDGGIGHTIELDLKHTDAGPAEIAEALVEIERQRELALARASGAHGRAASRPSQQSSAEPSYVPAAPARPAFGRKRT